MSVSHYYSFKAPQTYLWEYIQSINLERFRHIGQPRWVLTIKPKSGTEIELPLPILYFNNTLFSQEETLTLIEQAYNKQSLVYKTIDRKEERPARFNKQYINVISIFIVIFLLQFIIQLFMK